MSRRESAEMPSPAARRSNLCNCGGSIVHRPGAPGCVYDGYRCSTCNLLVRGHHECEPVYDYSEAPDGT